MRIEFVERTLWLEKYAQAAHTLVFDSDVTFEEGQFSHTMLVVDSDTDEPIIYMTIHQVKTVGIHIEYGGSFPHYRSSTKVLRAFQKANEWFGANGYKFVSLLTRNTNLAMNKLALHTGYVVTGLQVHKGKVFLEHIKEM